MSRKVHDFFDLLLLNLFSLRRVTFVQSYKSNPKSSLKNFSVILFICWFTIEYEESLHPILIGSINISIIVISTQSDKWKIFRLFRAVFIFKKFGSASNFINTERSGVLSEIVKWAERHFCPLLLLADKSGSPKA